MHYLNFFDSEPSEASADPSQLRRTISQGNSSDVSEPNIVQPALMYLETKLNDTLQV